MEDLPHEEDVGIVDGLWAEEVVLHEGHAALKLERGDERLQLRHAGGGCVLDDEIEVRVFLCFS